MQRPIFLLVAGDESRLDALRRDLSRRYEADYEVVSVASAGAALALLANFAASGAEVALLIADEHLTDMPAVGFLARAHEQHRGAKRVLLIDRGNWSAAHPAVSAMAVGEIDYHLYVPWHPLERILYPAVTEFLSAWDKSREIVEPDLPGGQAGTSSLIRNYLGFPHGLSGETSPTGLSNRRGCSARTPSSPGRTA
jgi:thioredoxin reductase (NADPH)